MGHIKWGKLKGKLKGLIYSYSLIVLPKFQFYLNKNVINGSFNVNSCITIKYNRAIESEIEHELGLEQFSTVFSR